MDSRHGGTGVGRHGWPIIVREGAKHGLSGPHKERSSINILFRLLVHLSAITRAFAIICTSSQGKPRAGGKAFLLDGRDEYQSWGGHTDLCLGTRGVHDALANNGNRSGQSSNRGCKLTEVQRQHKQLGEPSLT